MTSSIIRVTFRPPVVEPAQPPMNIKPKRMNLEKTGHCSKSLETKPVDDEMDTDWKKAWRNASTLSHCWARTRLRVIAAVEMATMDK